MKFVEPKVLSFVTTDRCNASCVNCCYNCSPQGGQSLSYIQMKRTIDEIVKDFPTVKVCVFTGGECTLLGADLLRTIFYANSCKLICRIVTNAHWAVSENKAYSYLSELKCAGLKELNISTGDEHQKWVSYDRVVNACLSAVKLGISVVVSIESTVSSTFTSKVMSCDDRLKKVIENKQVILKDSFWIEFDKKEVPYHTMLEGLNDGPCTNLFNIITVTPDYYLLACCGLTSKGNKYLKIGSLENKTLRNLYEMQFDDLLKLWLFTHGPKCMYQFLCKERNKIDDSHRYQHICSLCCKVLNDEDNILLIKNNIKKIIPSVLFKYHFINN